MATLLLKYITRNYWKSGKLRPNEKNTIRQIIMERMVELDGKIAMHLVYAPSYIFIGQYYRHNR